MEEQGILELLETILGNSIESNKGNYKFVCPFHVSNPPGKFKLEINIQTEKWHCWGCDKKGQTLDVLLNLLKSSPQRKKELKLLLKNKEKNVKSVDLTNKTKDLVISLPKEFISLNNFSSSSKIDSIYYKQAINFLNKRGITQQDIIKYNIGFCTKGFYKERIIIPSYDGDGIINYFMARDFTGNCSQADKYKNPPISAKDVIGWELYINWDAPIILVEGIFDALTIKRNVIPLFGKNIHPKLMKKLVKSSVDKIYIALDADAYKKALNHAEQLLSYGKEVYLVELDGKDANEIGFERFLNIIENTSKLTFQSLLEIKLNHL